MSRRPRRSTRPSGLVGVLMVTLLGSLGLAACDPGGRDPVGAVGQGGGDTGGDTGGDDEGLGRAGTGRSDERAQRPTRAPDKPPRGTVTLAFAGDMHFELQHQAMLRQPRGALGPIASVLREADLTMVNLETALTTRGTGEQKKYLFRTGPRALDVLDQAGVDVASMANNHAVDYGIVGLRDTLRAKRNGPLPVVGVGADAEEAFAPWRARVGSTDVSFLAASSRREYTMDNWSSDEDSPGIAAARHPRPQDLIAAVERERDQADVIVVYLHWGDELATCPDSKQRTTARSLVAAGADVVIGTHAHVLMGAGMLEAGGRTGYVGYGLGNFLWYHNYTEETGVLEVDIRDGEVVGDTFRPALIQPSGVPIQLSGAAADAATRSFEQLRSCTGLDPA